MPALTRAGWFLCDVKEWGIREAKDSGAIAVALKFLTKGEWGTTDAGPGWVETPQSDVFGDFYVIKKDGEPNPTGLEQLTKAGIWRADKGFEGFNEPIWDGAEAVIQVEADTYGGKTRYKAAWIYGSEHIPGTGGIANRASAERLAELNAKMGARLRAIAPKTTTVAAAAPPAAAAAPAQPPLVSEWMSTGGVAVDEVPF